MPVRELGPNSRAAEESVVGQLLSEPTLAQIAAAELLQPDQFYYAPMRLLYAAIIEAHFADEAFDALTIGEETRRQLAKLMNCSGPDAVQRVQKLASGRDANAVTVVEHGKIVKEHAARRELLHMAKRIERSVEDESLPAEEIAGGVAQEGMRLATSGTLSKEMESFGDLGRDFLREIKVEIAARERGIELGAYFQMPAIDDYLHGLRGSELLFVGGEPGVGKSAAVWQATLNFAERQAKKDDPIGAFILSLEMAKMPSNIRLAQMLTGIDGAKLREGRVRNAELTRITQEWAGRQNLPLWFNFTSTLRASQLRALVAEAVRKHRVGLVVIDHFRYFDLDTRHQNPNVEDEEKARFLKENIGKDMNVAVVCIAHTTKSIETEDGRPTLKHLRGSGQVAAHADFVTFMHRPFDHVSESDRAGGGVKRTDAEFVWRKNRHGQEGIAKFYFDPARMDIR